MLPSAYLCWQQKNLKLVYRISSRRVLDTNDADEPGLKVSYLGSTINKLNITLVKFKNVGDAEILPNDFTSSSPLAILHMPLLPSSTTAKASLTTVQIKLINFLKLQQ